MAKKLVKLDAGVVAEYDQESGRTITHNLAQLEAQLGELQARLDELGEEEPGDAEVLAWAKEARKKLSDGYDRQMLKKEIARLEKLVGDLKKAK